MNLTHLFNKHGSDKHQHGYGAFYQEHLPAQVRSLLEVGVLRGHSMNAWKEAFPNAALYGLDLFIENPIPNIDGVKFFKGNQLDYELLYHIRNDVKPQVIVDDGSHNSGDMWVTMITLIGCCEYYFIEDLACCRDPFWRQGLTFDQTILGAMLNERFPFSYTLSADQKIAVVRNIKR